MVPLCPSLVESLRKLERAEDVTQFMVLTTALSVVLHQMTNQMDFAIGTLISGRNRVELERLIGLFVNTLVLRCDLSGNPTFRQLLKRTRRTSLDAFSHAEVPAEMLVRKLKLPRSFNRHPLFDVLFQLRNMPAARAERRGIGVEVLPLDYGISRFDLLIEVVQYSNNLFTCFEYNTNTFESSTIETMIELWQATLIAAVAQPGHTLSQLVESTRDHRRYQNSSPDRSARVA